jgi:riboflavin synthase
MFTGLVSAVGEVVQANRDDQGLELVIGSPYTDLMLGESIAIDGACLTVARIEAGGIRVHIVHTSLARTNFGSYAQRRRVNLERALRVGDRLGGHMVQGHVDGVGTVTGVETAGDALLLDIEVPESVALVSIPLGSITVDGVSLTVNARPDGHTVQVSLIPHTLDETTLRDRKVGDRVHLEGDLIGKYVWALLKERAGQGSSDVFLK